MRLTKDPLNNRVLRFDKAASKANGAAADGVLGQANFTGEIYALTATGMHWPIGVAVDSAGRLWVADQSNHRVLRFAAGVTLINDALADGVLGQVDVINGTFATTATAMANPTGVAVDSAGRLWVADTNNHRALLFKDMTKVAIKRAGSSPTGKSTVDFDVTFSSPIVGLSVANFALTADGVSGARITNISGSGTTWTVIVSTGSGIGTLRLDMLNDTWRARW